jgi:hypothetical protein
MPLGLDFFYFKKRNLTASLFTATVPFSCGVVLVASRLFSVSLNVFSQGNLRRRSLKGTLFATTS